MYKGIVKESKCIKQLFTISFFFIITEQKSLINLYNSLKINQLLNDKI